MRDHFKEFRVIWSEDGGISRWTVDPTILAELDSLSRQSDWAFCWGSLSRTNDIGFVGGGRMRAIALEGNFWIRSSGLGETLTQTNDEKGVGSSHCFWNSVSRYRIPTQSGGIRLVHCIHWILSTLSSVSRHQLAAAFIGCPTSNGLIVSQVTQHNGSHLIEHHERRLVSDVL